ncbi:MBG domain-containing protein [Rhizobium oryzicola]|uniref:MBG domain-containing protein n=1 Tax=Rhizobium oryzicola TaxID=1232668 RepID=A0ABT8SZZ2_9HYPH|nr:MBG domain-containing protein [Rhizobium oryzicola]MDO1583463.1 MBG domain-containing protein [Rhizobium oryzicola]
MNGDTLSGTLATVATPASNVGTYGITQGTLGNSNYAITYTGADVTISARPITVTADAQSMVYGDAVPTLTYTVGGSGLVNGDTLSGTLAIAATSASNVGTYGITQGTLGNSNYAITYTGADVTISARPITVTADAQSMVYGDAVPTLTYTVGGSGLVNGDTLSGTLATAATPASNVGTYAITQGTLGNSNYAITYASANVSVTPATLIITASDETVAEGGTMPQIGYTVSGWKNQQTDSLLTAVMTSSDAPASLPPGNYKTYASGGALSGAATGNYTLTYQQGQFTVTAANGGGTNTGGGSTTPGTGGGNSGGGNGGTTPGGGTNPGGGNTDPGTGGGNSGGGNGGTTPGGGTNPGGGSTTPGTGGGDSGGGNGGTTPGGGTNTGGGNTNPGTGGGNGGTTPGGGTNTGGGNTDPGTGGGNSGGGNGGTTPGGGTNTGGGNTNPGTGGGNGGTTPTPPVTKPETPVVDVPTTPPVVTPPVVVIPTVPPIVTIPDATITPPVFNPVSVVSTSYGLNLQQVTTVSTVLPQVVIYSAASGNGASGDASSGSSMTTQHPQLTSALCSLGPNFTISCSAN